MYLKVTTLALAAFACASPLDAPIKATNDDPCEPCRPQGATGTTPPAVGSDLSTLYSNILGSIKGIEFSKRRAPAPLDGRDSTFCCRASLDCVNVQNLNIPMCYDKFTLNFAFQGSSYGSLSTGEYKSGSDSANLLTGDYSAGGQQGNIYASKAQDKPNTSTISLPPQYTGTGVGSAVPPNEIGSVIVYTTTLPGHTYSQATTIPPSVVVNTINGVAVTSTMSAVTVTQATTIAAQTNVVTTTNPEASASASTGAGAQLGIDGTGSAGMGLISALIYALYAL